MLSKETWGLVISLVRNARNLLAVNGPQPVADLELVVLLDGRSVGEEAGDDHPVGREGGVLRRLLAPSWETG